MSNLVVLLGFSLVACQSTVDEQQVAAPRQKPAVVVAAPHALVTTSPKPAADPQVDRGQVGLPLSRNLKHSTITDFDGAPTQAPAGGAAGPQGALTTSPMAPTDPEGPRLGESTEQEQTDLASAFDSQNRDAAWSDRTEARFGSEFANSGGRSLVSVECRTTLCKLVLSPPPSSGRHSDRVVDRLFSRALSEDDGFYTHINAVRYSKGPGSTMTVYISRNHYALPDRTGFAAELHKQGPGK
jgi:hypothetical protein